LKKNLPLIFHWLPAALCRRAYFFSKSLVVQPGGSGAVVNKKPEEAPADWLTDNKKIAPCIQQTEEAHHTPPTASRLVGTAAPHIALSGIYSIQYLSFF
jgi:hypothetical protein